MTQPTTLDGYIDLYLDRTNKPERTRDGYKKAFNDLGELMNMPPVLLFALVWGGLNVFKQGKVYTMDVMDEMAEEKVSNE